MPDDPRGPFPQLDAALKIGKLSPAKVTPARLARIRRTGFAFARGDVVIDVVTGRRATIAAARPAVVGGGAVYEIAFGADETAARLERELELDPTPPTTAGA